jgi:hypothetical protein
VFAVVEETLRLLPVDDPRHQLIAQNQFAALASLLTAPTSPTSVSP